MTLEEYNAFCEGLPASAHVVQWGGAHVWKVGGPKGKVFAIAGWDDDAGEAAPFITFKTSDLSYDLLKDQPGLRPAPYLASRGMKWIQRIDDSSMDDAALQDYLTESHRLAAGNLTRKARVEFGLA